MSKAPAFQLYSNDFYVDTTDWSPEEVGVYTRLLLVEWSNGPLPNDMDRLARIAGQTPKKFRHNWIYVSTKFIQNVEGKLINVRLEQTRDEQRKYSESRSNNVKKRWEKKDTYVSTHEIHNGIDTAYPSSSSSLKEKNIIKKEKTRQQKLTDEEYFSALKNNPAYHGIDIDIQIGKCQAWCLSNNRVFSRRTFINWLNRVEKPIALVNKAASPAFGLSPEQERRIKEIEEQEAHNAGL